MLAISKTMKSLTGFPPIDDLHAGPSTGFDLMLDTNIISELIRNLQGQLRSIPKAGEAQVCTSIIVAAELRYGARRRSKRLPSH